MSPGHAIYNSLFKKKQLANGFYESKLSTILVNVEVSDAHYSLAS